MKTFATFHLITIFLSISLCVSCKRDDISAPDRKKILSIRKDSITLEKSLFISTRVTVELDGEELDSTSLSWRSSDSRIAKVNSQGYITPLIAGEAIITALLRDGSDSVFCKVKVVDNQNYKIRLQLKDKGASAFSIANPLAYLSQRALDRRTKHNIPIDETDLPISPTYIKEIEKLGGKVVARSKWLKTVTVQCEKEILLYEFKKLGFVKEAVVVWSGKNTAKTSSSKNERQIKDRTADGLVKSDSGYYGAAWDNIYISRGQILHDKGFKGETIDIAVLDAGFKGMNMNPLFAGMNIKGSKSFVYENDDPFALGNHGVWVSSCMAGNKPGNYVGTAPKASYWLFRTEDESSEFPVEEDYWVNALEYADSAGVDLVNSSLGYYFNEAGNPLKHSETDGKSAYSSKAANIAASKGILLVVCAGNDQSWVGTPADSPGVLTVGSIRRQLLGDTFTSWGATADGRVKPDVMALGGSASIIDIDGRTSFRSGTSYASPIICGLAACLWQAFPKLNNMEIIEILRKSSDRYQQPTDPYGYGVADMQKAFAIATETAAGR